MSDFNYETTIRFGIWHRADMSRRQLIEEISLRKEEFQALSGQIPEMEERLAAYEKIVAELDRPEFPHGKDN